MTSILTEWGKKCFEKLIKRAIEELHFIVCFTCIVKEFKEERERLKPERESLDQHVKVAIGRNKDISADVIDWEKEVDKLIAEDTETKQTCFFGFCPDCVWRYTRGKQLDNSKGDIKRLIEKREKFQNIELPRCVPDVERVSSQDYISFKGRESAYRELLDALKDDKNYITGLQGMGGTGKTTLANKVGKELKESGHFTHVISVIVSFTPDIKKIQDVIAGRLGLKWEDCNESDRPGILWDRLTNGEKILLIMDDIWDRDQDAFLDFDAIGIPNRDKHKGCRVLVTTRSKKISHKMNFDKSIELKLLSEEDAWTMFKMFANISDNSPTSVIDKGRKIAEECKQLPVAIAAIARSLQGQQHRMHAWDAALTSLKNPLSMHDVDKDMVGFYKCLKFSYDNMEDIEAKRLFLLCSLFPEDEEISDKILTRLYIGVGSFGEDFDIYNDVRNKVVVAKDLLIDSCLLLEVDKTHVKLHDLVRDVAQWIGKEEIRRMDLSNKNQKSLVEMETNIRCLYCQGRDIDLFSCKFDSSKLETLIVHVNKEVYIEKVPDSFFENIVNLRVFYFLGYDHTIMSLPTSIQSLKNIRSILVRKVLLGNISVLGKLQSLETLDLVGCTIKELPIGIAKLNKFRSLSLEDCVIIMNNPFEVIVECSSLEELYFTCKHHQHSQKITLPELQRCHIFIGDGSIDESPSKSMVIDGIGTAAYFPKGTDMAWMQTTEVLVLIKINSGWRNLIPEIVPIDQGMNDLIKLRLEYDSKLEHLIDTTLNVNPIVFSKLVVLNLYQMKNLKGLCNGPVSFDSMNNLEELTIRHCGNLRSLFNRSPNLRNLKAVKLDSCSTLVSAFHLSSLPELEELKIISCKQLENIFTCESRVDDEIEETLVDGNNMSSSNSKFPKLKVIIIDDCQKMEIIFPLISTKDILLLEIVKIKICFELTYIFGQHVELPSLKKLKLLNVPNFIDIFPESYHSIEGSSTSNSKPQLKPIKSNVFSWSHIACCYRSKLRIAKSSKIPLPCQEDQPQDCSISTVPNLNCFSRSNIVCNITVLKLLYIPKIKSVFMLYMSTAPNMPLEKLTIICCVDLEQIIVDIGDGSDRTELDNVFPKLKKLTVSSCDKLEYIFGHISGKDHVTTHLHLPALESLILTWLPSLMGMCTKNNTTTMPPLTEAKLSQCPQLDFKSFGDFILSNSSMISTSQEISTATKELNGNMDHFLTLKKLFVSHNSNVENIFCLNEVNEQQINLGLEHVELYSLPMMTCLFECPKSYFALKNLKRIQIARCEKLEIVFSISIIRCLPQLQFLLIQECEELKHIFEGDIENQKMSNYVSSKTCFPKLEVLVIVKCNKLKSVFPIHICNKLPMLKAVIIKEANELEEIFGTKSNQKVEIPNLTLIAFVNLPSLCHAQGIQFQTIPYCFVRNCQNISLTSTLSFGFEAFDLSRNLGFDSR